MSDRFELKDATPQQAAEALTTETGHKIDESEVRAVVHLLMGASHDHDEVEITSLKRDRIPGTRIHVNVSRAAIVATILVLDLWKTRGMSIGLLAMIGFDPRVITQLSTTDGCLCNLGAIEHRLRGRDTNDLVNAETIMADLTRGSCRHRHLPCLHRHDKRCMIDKQSVQGNFSTLAEKGCIRLGTKGEVVEIV